MHPPKITHKRDRDCVHALLVVSALAVLGILVSVSLNISNYHSAYLEAKAYQRDKAQEVQNQILHFIATATQLADTLQILIEHDRGRDKKQVEKYLDIMLESAPSDLVYGAGVWWEPYAFDGKTFLFGPYVHRGSDNSRVITYEWCSEDYNFPSRSWYQSGIQSKREHFLTEPYDDNGITYITLVKSFRDSKSGQEKGVITIDMVLPQLQNIVDKANSKESEELVVIGKSGQVLAHPDPNQLMDKARRLHPNKSIHNILDVLSADNIYGRDQLIRYAVTMPKIGWTIVVSSSPEELMANYYKLRRVIALATLVYLVTLLSAYFLIRYFMRSLDRQRDSFIYAEKMASLGEMAGGIAHEINNPLAIIQGAAQKLQIRLKHEELNRQDMHDTVGVILKTAERIARIIRSLRFVARDGSLDPFVDNNLRAIVDETLALSEARLKYEDVHLDASHVPADLRCVCRGVQISQVLINLINNAMDAIRFQSEKWIRIEASTDGPNLQLAVVDSGPGIPEELTDRIMKPFFTTKEVGKGTGLGLSISRGIAQAHGGDLKLDRRSTHTRFVLTLPGVQNRPESQDERYVASDPEAAPPASGNPAEQGDGHPPQTSSHRRKSYRWS